MPWTSIIQQTDSVRQARRGDPSQMDREWIVRTGTGQTADEVRADAQCPAVVRQRLPAPHSDYVCTEVGVTHLAKDTWRITASFVARALSDTWQRISMTGRTRTVQVWRVPTSYPADFASSVTSPSVVIGTLVDINGKPVEFPNTQSAITVDTCFNRAYHKYANSDSLFPIIAAEALVNKRNDAQFLGYPKGMVLCTGYSLTDLDDTWMQLSQQFLADQWGHLEQRVGTAADGKYIPSPVTSTWGSLVITHARDIYWWQQYQLLATFPAYGEIITPTPAWT